jgi:hypothetical protein
MSEQQTNEQQAATEQEVNLANPFSEGSWTDPSVNADAPSSNNSFAQSNAHASQSQDEEEIYDANEYLKMKLGFDDWDSAAKQINELKQKQAFEFENEDSRRFYEYAKENKEDELINFLQEKKKIEKLSTAEIKDPNTAAEIVKYSMFQKNKSLEQDEIEFLFNEKFSKPSKPEQSFDELDSEYERRVSDWENKVNEVEKRLIIEAKLARPDLESAKSSLVLPDINPSYKEAELTPEVLEAQKKYMDYYYGSVNDAINSFEGFSAAVKDEGADFNVAYVPSNEEKQAVAQQLNYFAENNLDANMIFADRWVNDDGTINVKQMTKDLFLLQNEGKITQKYVNEAANRRLAMHLKNSSNINLSGNTSSGTFSPDNRQSEMDKLAAVMFAK